MTGAMDHALNVIDRRYELLVHGSEGAGPPGNRWSGVPLVRTYDFLNRAYLRLRFPTACIGAG
jgi:hypothetical protein